MIFSNEKFTICYFHSPQANPLHWLTCSLSRLLLIIGEVNNWDEDQIIFFLSFLPRKRDVNMKRNDWMIAENYFEVFGWVCFWTIIFSASLVFIKWKFYFYKNICWDWENILKLFVYLGSLHLTSSKKFNLEIFFMI